MEVIPMIFENVKEVEIEGWENDYASLNSSS